MNDSVPKGFVVFNHRYMRWFRSRAVGPVEQTALFHSQNYILKLRWLSAETQMNLNIHHDI